MGHVTQLHGGLSLAYPDGFCELTPDELNQAYHSSYPNIWGIRDEERHAMLAIFWKDSNKLLGMLASTESLAKRAAKLMAKAMKNHGYQFGGFFSTQLAGCEAHGFRYAFTGAGDVAQEAETIVFKHENTCYTVYYYTRPETAADNRATYEDLLASLTFGRMEQEHEEHLVDPAVCIHSWEVTDTGSCENTYSSYGGGVELQTWTVERCPHCGSNRFSCTDTSCLSYEECRQIYE